MTSKTVLRTRSFRKAAIALAAAVVASVVPGVARAALVLGVDFQITAAASGVQPGFSAFEIGNPGPNANVAKTFAAAGVTSGSLEVTLFTVQGGGRNRGSVNGTFAPLLGDLVTNFTRAASATPTGSPANSIRVTGLDASTDYEVRVWSLDRGFNNGAIYRWFDTTAGAYAAFPGTITNVAGGAAVTASNETDFSVVATLRSSAAGQITLSHHDSVGTGTLNGLRISTVAPIPEPAVLGLLVPAGLLMGRRRK